MSDFKIVIVPLQSDRAPTQAGSSQLFVEKKEKELVKNGRVGRLRTNVIISWGKLKFLFYFILESDGSILESLPYGDDCATDRRTWLQWHGM